MRPVSWGVWEPMKNRQSELQEKNFKTRKGSVSRSLFLFGGLRSRTPKICLAYPFCGPPLQKRGPDALWRSRNEAPAKCASIWKGASEDKSKFSGGLGAAFRFAGADLSVHGSFHKGLICGSVRARRGAGQGEALLEVETPTF